MMYLICHALVRYFWQYIIVNGSHHLPLHRVTSRWKLKRKVYQNDFRAWPSRLYELTQMPFGLSHSGSHFSPNGKKPGLSAAHDVMCDVTTTLGCVFAASIDKRLSRIELVFKRLNSFNLKIKPKKFTFSSIVWYF